MSKTALTQIEKDFLKVWDQVRENEDMIGERFSVNPRKLARELMPADWSRIMKDHNYSISNSLDDFALSDKFIKKYKKYLVEIETHNKL